MEIFKVGRGIVSLRGFTVGILTEQRISTDWLDKFVGGNGTMEKIWDTRAGLTIASYSILCS